MENVQVKTVKPSRFGQSVILGKTKVLFNAEGIGEIDEDLLKSVIEADPELELVKPVNTDNEGKIAYRKELNALKKDEILKMAIDSELPEEEYKDLNKTDLIEYLIGKL
jgi:hypothetical protein